MRVLLLTHTFNSLSQRLFVELRALGHEVSVEFDIADSVSEEAVALYQPDLIVAPYLRRAIAPTIWSRHVCLVVHPGIVGDRGPSALDWAIVEGESQWGVTVLQANGELDAGDVWAHREFPMRRVAKASLYRFEVTEAAAQAVLEAVAKFESGGYRPTPLARLRPPARGRARPPMRQADRRIDWHREPTAAVVRKIDAADGSPGIDDALFGVPCRLFDAHADGPIGARPGEVVARRDGAVLRATVDGSVWIGHARRLDAGASQAPSFKLPTTAAFPEQAARLAEQPATLWRDSPEPWGELRYREIETAQGQARVGLLHFDFYNGAAGTGQCRRLLQAYRFARSRPTRVIVLMGGGDFWCNGIHLNLIEAAESPADESWANIEAIDDVAREIIETDAQLTVAALRGNAGAGGVFLALAADRIWARSGVILNPHYKNMGNLYGSEYWTYLLPRRAGEASGSVMQRRLPVAAGEAVGLGLIDEILPGGIGQVQAQIEARALALACAPDFEARLCAKREARARDEAHRPLQAYRDHELAHMRRNFYGFDPSYHVARAHFVLKIPHAWTPRHLAIHR